MKRTYEVFDTDGNFLTLFYEFLDEYTPKASLAEIKESICRQMGYSPEQINVFKR